MRPQPNSEKSGAQQLDEAYKYLTSSGIRVVTQYGLSVGIYTNYYDWSQITNGTVVGNTMLWYWNVYGSGEAGESQPNFKDFDPFSGWSAPTVKQFGQVESVCGVTVNSRRLRLLKRSDAILHLRATFELLCSSHFTTSLPTSIAIMM
ncbi:hypothetical protein KIN20_006332 [Parelaphostrongylus tenuis]|uniref:Lysozyme n=1 Tax=Parelaphostrongylus tenuis TaxID=148309 RepID=A0AAD5MK75_PARTN|nr:hypothetical protein KIN20_006332 [Parelaphostrongylus tenuis]